MEGIKYDLIKFTDDELCRIYNNLNCWTWDELLGVKPDGWDELPRYHNSEYKNRILNSKRKIIEPVMENIEEKLGKKTLLEWHWIHNLGGIKEGFEAWLFKEIADDYFRFH